MIEDILIKEYRNLIRKPNEILSIFSDFYGEDKVDLQGLPSLEEFISHATVNMNVPLWLSNNGHNFTFNQRRLLKEKFDESLTKKDKDYSFNNPDIMSEFYRDYILRVISNKFGNISILIYFPSVTVTNEYDKSVEIQKLFAKVDIDVKGLMRNGVTFNRAEYPLSQLLNKYMHSHIQDIEYSNLRRFKSSCLGSGPIRDTISMLCVDYDTLRWQMFALELSKYVQVESIAGNPYKRMEHIKKADISQQYREFIPMNEYVFDSSIRLNYDFLLKNFIRHLISLKKLKFNYYNNSFGLAMSYIEFNIFVSNEFINWFNSNLGTLIPVDDDRYLLQTMIGNALLIKCSIINNTINIYSSNQRNVDNIIERAKSQFACTFKGENIPITVTNDIVEDNNLIMLHPNITNLIFNKLISITNINYGTNNTITTEYGEERTSNRVQGSFKTFLTNH